MRSLSLHSQRVRRQRSTRISLERLESRDAPAIITWTGGSTGNATAWATAANWSPAQVPGVSDDAIIPLTGSNPTISTGTASVRSITTTRTLAVGQLTVGAAVSTFRANFGTSSGNSVKVANGGTLDHCSFFGTGSSVNFGSNTTLQNCSSTGSVFLSGTNTKLIGLNTLSGKSYLNGTFDMTDASGSNNSVIDLQGGQLGLYGTLTTKVGLGGTRTITGGKLYHFGTITVEAETVLSANVSFYETQGMNKIVGNYNIAGTLRLPIGSNVFSKIVSSIILNGPRSRVVDSSNVDLLTGLTTITGSGRLTLLNGRNFKASGPFSSQGVINVGSGSTFTASESFTNDGVLAGSGKFAGRFNGTVSPGSTTSTLSQFPGFGSGTLTLNGSVRLKKYVADPDRLVVTGAVQIAGPLVLNDGFTFIGQSVTLIDNDGTDPVVGTFTDIPQLSTFVIGSRLVQINYQGGTGNDVTLTAIDTSLPGPVIPRVESVVINDGAVQRSRVTKVEVTFDSIVTLPANPALAFWLVRVNDNAPVTVAAQVTNDTKTHVSLTFVSGAVHGSPTSRSLADGRYSLGTYASQVNRGIFDGNGDGVSGDNYLFAEPALPAPLNLSKIFCFAGDISGDGAVAANDFIQFRMAFGGSNAAFDFDGDGVVSTADFIIIRNGFGALP